MSLQSTLLFLLLKAFQKPYAATADDSGHTKRLDLDSVSGFEVSATIRGGDVSIDTHYNSFDAELLDAGITDLRCGSQAVKPACIKSAVEPAHSKKASFVR